MVVRARSTALTSPVRVEVDPVEGLLAVPASLQASPYNYGAGRRVEVRDEQGRIIDLKPGADREYRAEFTAAAPPATTG